MSAMSKDSRALIRPDITRVVENAVICNIYDLGYMEGHKEGERVGRSTLSRGWFFAVALLMLLGGILFGIVMSLTMGLVQ